MIAESDMDMPAYDLGWAQLSTDHESDKHSIPDSGDDDWTYHFGWEGANSGTEPMQDCIDLTQDDSPNSALDWNDQAYNLG